MNQMSEQARAAQRAYRKKWREANKDKVRESNRRYWERKAAQLAAAETPEGGKDE